MLKAVIFDFDGLLSDSSPLHQQANKIFLESYGKVYFSNTSGREGMRIIDIVSDFKDIYNLPGSLEKLYQERQAIFFKIAQKKLALYPTALPLLEKLKKRKLKLALATSADKNFVKIIYSKFPKFKQLFDTVVTGDDIKRGKPYPDMYEKTLKLLKIQPSEAVVFEDSINGIVSAQKAGMQVICIPNQHYPNQDYSLAQKTFTTLAEATASIA